MAGSTENWRTQIRKGYLELCILLMIKRQKKVYGFDLLERLAGCGLAVKEGTVYPLLNRMSTDGLLAATWDMENLKGHPRKFYSLTKDGAKFLGEMAGEFEEMFEIFKAIEAGKTKTVKEENA